MYHCACLSWGTSLDMGYFCYMSSTWTIPGDCEWYTCTHFTMKALAAAVLGLHWSNITVLCYMTLCYGYVMVMYVCCYSCCVSQERDRVVAAMPARREWMYLQFLRLLASSSSFLACALPTLDLWTVQTVWTGSAIKWAKKVLIDLAQGYLFDLVSYHFPHHNFNSLPLRSSVPRT